MQEHLFGFLLGYGFGAIPFGLLLAMAAGKGDIRQIGSGNIGATNVLRTGSKWLAAAVLLLDLGKGLVPVLVARAMWDMPGDMFGAVPLAAMGAVVGHCFPVWLKFKGGKGVATNLGVSIGLAWPIGLTYAFVWLAMAGAFRISSLAGMTAVVGAAVAAFVYGYPQFVPVLAVIAALVLWLHRANIGRLMRGEEPKIGKKS